MPGNRYVKDYRLIETVDAKGHIHTDYEYIGPDYYYIQKKTEVARELRRRLVTCLAGWGAYVCAMLPNSRAMHIIFISLSFVFCAIPLAVMTGAVLSLRRIKEPLEHRDADKLTNRFPPAALILTILSTGALLAQLVMMGIGSNRSIADALFSVCCLFLVFCGGSCFAGRNRLSVRKDN